MKNTIATMDKYYVGIDPGKSPAICLLDSSGDIIKISLIKNKEGEVFPFDNYMYEISDIASRHHGLFTMELPHSVFGASAKSNFNFGIAIGACIQAIESNMCDGRVSQYIPPKAWTSWIWEDVDTVPNKNGKGRDTKATSFNSAKRILGSRWDDTIFIPTNRSKVVNHNMIDAYLIAEYGRQLDT